MSRVSHAQLRYALDDATNLRFAVTTAMARPLYSDLAWAQEFGSPLGSALADQLRFQRLAGDVAHYI